MMFFFSSRRRHTRCLSDWSSDVCSSDLMFQFLVEALVLCLVGGVIGILFGALGAVALSKIAHWNTRSEERRVGKERRNRWSARQANKESNVNAKKVVEHRHRDERTLKMS